MMTPKVIMAPLEEPLTIEQCRAQCNVVPYETDSDGNETHPDDDLLMALQGAAREHCENFLGLSLSTRVLEIALDAFPSSTDVGGAGIELPMGPVRELVHIATGEVSSDADSDVLTVDNYVLDTYSHVHRVLPASLAVGWPSVTASTNVVKIRYLAGYGVDSDGGEALPYAIRAAILLVLAHLYRHREDTTEMALASIPTGAENLMRPLRLRLGMA